jgi:hypothetical protein
LFSKCQKARPDPHQFFPNVVDFFSQFDTLHIQEEAILICNRLQRMGKENEKDIVVSPCGGVDADGGGRNFLGDL